MSKQKDHADEPKVADPRPADGSPEPGTTHGNPVAPMSQPHADMPPATNPQLLPGGGTPIVGTHLTGTLPGASPQPSRAMFRVLKSITGGHEPGEIKSHADLVGPHPDRPAADVDWLVKVKSIEPVDHVHAADVTRPDLEDEIERLTGELDKARSERDQFRELAQKHGADLSAFPAPDPAEADAHTGGPSRGRKATAKADGHAEPSAGPAPPQPLGEGRHDGPKKAK